MAQKPNERPEISWQESPDYERIQESRGITTPEMLEKIKGNEKEIEKAVDRALNTFMNSQNRSSIRISLIHGDLAPYDEVRDLDDATSDKYHTIYLGNARRTIAELDIIRQNGILGFENSFLGYIDYTSEISDPTVPPQASSKETFETLKLLLPHISREKMLELLGNKIKQSMSTKWANPRIVESLLLAELAFGEALAEANEFKQEKDWYDDQSMEPPEYEDPNNPKPGEPNPVWLAMQEAHRAQQQRDD